MPEPINRRKVWSWRIRASAMKIKPIKCSDFLCVLTACMEVWTQYKPNWSCETSRSIKILGHYQSRSGFSQQPSILSSHPFPKDFLMNFTGIFASCQSWFFVLPGSHHAMSIAKSAMGLTTQQSLLRLCVRHLIGFAYFMLWELQKKKQQPTAQCLLPLPKRHLD